MIAIDTREEYNYAVKRGFNPLVSLAFKVDISLRIELQKELFTGLSIQERDQKFYRWCWEHYPQICQETGKPLRHYSASCISHILTRAAFPEMRHDPRNINILRPDIHTKWENGTDEQREKMIINAENQYRIKLLKEEYGQYYKINS